MFESEIERKLQIPSTFKLRSAAQFLVLTVSSPIKEVDLTGGLPQKNSFSLPKAHRSLP